ncbi:MAG: hypothetical protein U1E68_06695 [Sphingomonadaceae bacterium]|jgi:hypothetical protein
MPEALRQLRAKQSDLFVDDEMYEMLSGHIQETYARLDATRCEALRMEADFIESAGKIRLKPEMTQKLIAKSYKCLGSMEETRKDLLAFHATATVIRMQTNQAERGYGTYKDLWLAAEEKPNLRSVA